MSDDFPRPIALINPIPGFGSDLYTHELAQGLAANGVRIDVYCSDVSHINVREPVPAIGDFTYLALDFLRACVTRLDRRSPRLLSQQRLRQLRPITSATEVGGSRLPDGYICRPSFPCP